MIDLRTSQRHRLVQVFLSGFGVFEVYCNVKTHAFSCTCPGFAARAQCKHATHVHGRYAAEGGCYPAKLRKGAKPQSALTLDSAEKFREWIIDNARVEVLD